MPYARKTNYRRKKPVKKAYRPRMYKPMRRRIPMVQEPRRLVKLRYTDMQTLNPAAGATAQYNYRLMSLYDPDQSGVGAQPAGFDQWMTLYKKFTVLGAKITVRATGTTTGSVTGGGIIGLNVQHVARTLGVPKEAIVAKNSTWKLFTNKAGGPACVTLKYFWSAKKHFGISAKDSLIGKDQYAGTEAASPAVDDDARLAIWACGANETVDPDPIDFIITIDYIAMFTEPLVQAES